MRGYDDWHRPVVPGGAAGAMAPPNFGRSVNPISTKGGRLCPLKNAGTPGFSDLPTAFWLRNTYVLQNKTKRYKLADKTIDEELSFFIHVSQCRAILNYVGILFSVWSFQVQTEKEIISRLKGQICPFKYLLLGHTITTWTRWGG